MITSVFVNIQPVGKSIGIHGTGIIFTYMKTIINQPNLGKSISYIHGYYRIWQPIPTKTCLTFLHGMNVLYTDLIRFRYTMRSDLRVYSWRTWTWWNKILAVLAKDGTKTAMREPRKVCLKLVPYCWCHGWWLAAVVSHSSNFQMMDVSQCDDWFRLCFLLRSLEIHNMIQ